MFRPETNGIDPTAVAMEDWRAFLETTSLELLFAHAEGEPLETPDGTIYEMPNFLGGAESVAIVDMRGVAIDTPHYHDDGEVEGHIVLDGEMDAYVGGEEKKTLQAGDQMVVPSGVAHFVTPRDAIVLVLSFPDYQEEHQKPVTGEDPVHLFSQAQYDAVAAELLAA